ncbi:MAG: hypothetical protein AAGB48_10470 [Planctomycetota bacterium]
MRAFLVPAILLLLVGLQAVWAAGWLRQHEDRLVREQQRLVQSRAAASELRSLRTNVQTDLVMQDQTESLLPSLREALVAADLPAGALQELRTESDRLISGERSGIPVRRRVTLVSLSPLTPAELGRLLDACDPDIAPWLPLRIELKHRPREGAGRYGARLWLTADYLDPDGEAS